MAHRRHTLNPAKVKIEVNALEGKPPPEGLLKRLGLRRRLSVALLCLLTVALLTVSFTPYDCWYLAYVSLVPWCVALAGGGSRRWALTCAVLTGVLFWAINLYWLWWITLIGYAALVIYLTVYWFVAAVIVRRAVARGWPLWAVLPVTWVALEYARAYVISGFPWFFLAHSQYDRTRLIQIADVTGQYGVSFFVAAVNGAVADLLCAPLVARARKGRELALRAISGLVLAALAAAGLLAYGTWQLSRETTAEGPVIGIVQQSFPIALGRPSASYEEVLRRHVEPTAEFQGKGCDLVLWPETMLPLGMNAEVLNADIRALNEADARDLLIKLTGPSLWEAYNDAVLRDALGGKGNEAQLQAMGSAELRDLAVRTFGPEACARLRTEGYRLALDRHINLGHPLKDGGTEPSLREHAGAMEKLTRMLRCPILAGGPALYRNPQPLDDNDRWVKANSALWFDPDAEPNRDSFPSTRYQYSKVHLVPFSEYVPFKQGWPGLHRALRWFVPPVMDQLAPGRRFTLFELQRRRKVWRIATPICYEGTFDYVCRQMVFQDGRKAADILANLSNDGWFVWKWWPDRGSYEHAQHLVQYCFRAVENRVPVVRAVNTGISASIDSSGRIVAVVEHNRARTAIPGALLLDGARRNDREYAQGHGPRVLVDSRVSVYSRFGDVFAMSVSLAAVVLVGWLVWKRRDIEEGDSK